MSIVVSFSIGRCLTFLQRGESFDPHLAKMKLYREVPMWWYALVLLGSFAMAMATL